MNGGRKSRGRAPHARSLFGTGAAFLLTAAPAEAAGFYLQQQSVRGWGRANSGEAADRGPASLWWNPASIGGQEETETAFGATLFLPVGEIGDQGTLIDRPGVAPVPVGGDALMPDPIQRGLLPGTAVALRLSTDGGRVVVARRSAFTRHDPSGWQRLRGDPLAADDFDIRLGRLLAAYCYRRRRLTSNRQTTSHSRLPTSPRSADGRIRIKGMAGSGLERRRAVRLRKADHRPRLQSRSAHLDGTVEITGLTGTLATQIMPARRSFSTPWQATSARAPSDRKTRSRQACASAGAVRPDRARAPMGRDRPMTQGQLSFAPAPTGSMSV